MLNSANGVTFPAPIEPPITTICSIRSVSSGCVRSSSAMLVSGPTGTSVTRSPCSRRIRAISSTACSGASGMSSPLGSSAPSSADSPCTVGAVRRPPSSGPGAPAATGTPWMPASAHVARALRVVRSSVPLPATVVIASRSISSLPAARMIATMSS